MADIPIDHPSTSKQHAVIQYRQAIERNEFGETKTMTKCVARPCRCCTTHAQYRPYIIDLDSANGTTVNDEQVPTQRFYELKSGDSECPSSSRTS